jgi:hypothetical protein
MYLANDGKMIPTRWEHGPTLQNMRGMTVAIYLAYEGKDIPTQWYHDPAT